MAIDLASEQIVTLREAAKFLPRQGGGRKVHICTLYRWTSRGVRGVRLETLKLGGTVVTSIEALQRFAERCSQMGSTPAKRKPRRSRELERAEQELDDAGI